VSASWSERVGRTCISRTASVNIPQPCVVLIHEKIDNQDELPAATVAAATTTTATATVVAAPAAAVAVAVVAATTAAGK